MRYIEQAGRLAGRQMLCLDAVGILHRHVPAGERHHPRAVGEVEIVKWGPAGLHGVTPVATHKSTHFDKVERALSVVEPERFPA